MSAIENNESVLQTISISPRKPAARTPHGTAVVKSAIIEYYGTGHWERLAEFCNREISGFIKDLPTPILSASTIFTFHYGAIAFKNLGNDEKFLACLKVLFSLREFAHHLNLSDQELLNADVDNYYLLSKERGVDYLNSIQVAEILKGKGCFIATAVYGSYSSSEVLILRQFRDEVLLKSSVGKLFVSFYYFISPSIADFISKRSTLKRLVRGLLIDPVVKYLQSKR
jgi:hypothetical protein